MCVFRTVPMEIVCFINTHYYKIKNNPATKFTYLHHDVVAVDGLLRFVDPALGHVLAVLAQVLKGNQAQRKLSSQLHFVHITFFFELVSLLHTI